MTEPTACVSCKPWKHFLYDNLKLDSCIRFKQCLNDKDPLAYCYSAVRPLGEDFEESVGFNFQFFRDGSYRLAWTRTYDAWSSQGEQHYGKWRLKMGQVCCETLEPQEEASETQMRYAPAGYKFAVPVEDILSAEGASSVKMVGSNVLSRILKRTTPQSRTEVLSSSSLIMVTPIHKAPDSRNPDQAA